MDLESLSLCPPLAAAGLVLLVLLPECHMSFLSSGRRSCS